MKDKYKEYADEMLLAGRKNIKESFQCIDIELARVKLFNGLRLLRIAYYVMGSDVKTLEEMYSVGIKFSAIYTCYYNYENGKYSIQCPFYLCKYPGLSIGGTFQYRCSICGLDPLFCSHQVGDFYEGVEVVHEIVNGEFDHLALVHNPVIPEAGVMEEEVEGKLLYYRGKFENIDIERGDRMECLFCKFMQSKSNFV